MRWAPGFAGVCLVFASALSAQTAPLYDVDTLRTFYFTFASSNWHTQLSQARTNGTNVKGDLTVDGQLYKDVGVRFRGNSSYAAVGTKKSINVTMDAFVPGQRLMGYDSLNLSNGFNDPTFCREVLAYGILRSYMPAPKANYVRVFVNNSYFGLFVNVQQPDGKFIKEWYKGSSGNRYRCDPPTRAGFGKSALQWLGTTLQSYKDAYELKNDPSTAVKPWEDVRDLCNVLNNTPNAQLASELPKILDVDQALWYLALNIVLVNLDSYVARGNDYYMYHDAEHGEFGLLPWDMNESFGGYANRMSITQRINLDPYYNQSSTNRPLLRKLFGVEPEWNARYFHHVKEVVDAEFHWGRVGPLVAKYQKLIDASVKSDPNLIYTYQMFKDNVTKQMFVNQSFFRTEIPGLKQLCDGRTAYIRSLLRYKQVAPTISNLVAPADPPPNKPAAVTVRVASTVPIGTVTLYYRSVGAWRSTAMFDDGNHADGKAGDGVFGAFVPAAVHLPGRRVDYYVGARSTSANGGAVSYRPAKAAFRAPSYVVGFDTGQSPVSINELVAINQNGIKDEKGETEDWLELYNAAVNPVKVGGMFLTDDPEKPTKWKIPVNYSIPGRTALLIWCDDDPLDGPLHATFKLSGSGEKVWLFDTDGKTQLGVLEFGPQQADISTGALFDGKVGPLVAYKAPTPAQPNSRSCSARGYWPVQHAAHRIGLSFTGVPRIASTGTHVRVTDGPVNGSVSLFLAPAAGVVGLGAGIHLMLSGPLLGPFGVPTGATGSADLAVSIPNDAALKGSSLFLQVGGTDAKGFTVSNGVEIRICN